MAYGHLKDTDTNIALSVGQSGMDEPALGIFMSTIPVVPTMSADKIIAAKVKAGKMTTIDTSQSDKGSGRRAPTDNKEEDMRSSLDEEEPLKEVINCRTLWRQVHIPPTPQGGGKQVLEFRGEVQLPRNLKPTCTFPLLNLEVRCHVNVHGESQALTRHGFGSTSSSYWVPLRSHLQRERRKRLFTFHVQ